MIDPLLERTRQLAAEQRTPIGPAEDPRIVDLRRVIHLLATALTDGKGVR